MDINQISLLGEHIGGTIAIIILYLVVSSKPKMTNTYFMVLTGFILSIIETILSWIIHKSYMYVSKDYLWFLYIICFLYLFNYAIISTLIYNYVYALSTNHIYNIRMRGTTVFSLSVYMILALYFLISGKLVFFVNDTIDLTVFHCFHLLFGLLTAIFIFFVTILNRKNFPRVLFGFILLFTIVDGAILVFQVLVPNIRFTSISYVLAFLIFYIVFHSIPYDQITGCQNIDSYQAKFQDNEIFHKKYLIAYIRFPQLQFSNYLNHRQADNDFFAMACRKIEQLDRSARFYRLDDSTFALFINEKDEKKAYELAKEVDRIVSNVMIYAKNKIVYNVVAFYCNKLINNQDLLVAMQNFLFEKVENDDQIKFYYATEEDYEKVHSDYVIEQELADICAKKDLDDERILCYTQPIYCVKEQAFRTAESLIRLKIDGKIYSPFYFISIAEEKKYIHILTCIMLHKVCKQLKTLQKDYKIDGISINCTSAEFSDRHLYQELLDIIYNNAIDPSSIKVELTESDIFSNMNIVLYNMTRLKNEGIQFYIDDFGTGYSNIERILECPFETVKFDKSLLYKSMKEKKFEKIEDHMISALKGIGLKILVEGVEDEMQKDYCVEHGYEYIQGFYFAKPLPIEELSQYLEKK